MLLHEQEPRPLAHLQHRGIYHLQQGIHNNKQILIMGEINEVCWIAVELYYQHQPPSQFVWVSRSRWLRRRTARTWEGGEG